MGDQPPTTGPAGTSTPVLVVVDDDPDLLRDVETELRKRYEPDYRVCALSSPDEALARLDECAAGGDDVALVLAGETLAGVPGTALLAEVRRTFPQAQRVLLIAWGHLGDPVIGEAIFEAIGARAAWTTTWCARLRRPTSSSTWRSRAFCSRGPRAGGCSRTGSRVVGKTWTGRAYEVRDVLERCAMPHRFMLADSAEGRALLGRDAGAALSGPRHARRGGSGGPHRHRRWRRPAAPPSPRTGTGTTW